MAERHVLLHLASRPRALAEHALGSELRHRLGRVLCLVPRACTEGLVETLADRSAMRRPDNREEHQKVEDLLRLAEDAVLRAVPGAVEETQALGVDHRRDADGVLHARHLERLRAILF